MSDPWWLVWSTEHESWAGPTGGYTADDRRAGRYTEAQARRECNGQPRRVMVLAPESWIDVPTDPFVSGVLYALVREAIREESSPTRMREPDRTAVDAATGR